MDILLQQQQAIESRSGNSSWIERTKVKSNKSNRQSEVAENHIEIQEQPTSRMSKYHEDWMKKDRHCNSQH